MRMRDDLLSAQKAVIEKDSLLQETNTLLLEQISKTSSESKQNEVIGGDKGLEKGNEITSPETTSESPYSLFFSACNHLRNSIINHIHLMVRILFKGGARN